MGSFIKTALALLVAIPSFASAEESALIRSARSGAWTDKATWEGGHVPYAGDKVQIRTGHEVVYDTDSDAAIHAIHIAGTLRFAPDKDTRLCVGLIRIEAGEEWKDGAAACHGQPARPDPRLRPPKLEIGSPERTIEAGHQALVRLVYFEGDDPTCLPAIICAGGQMDLHGARLARCWVTLAQGTASDQALLYPTDSVEGWRAGDHVVIAGNQTSEEAVLAASGSEPAVPRGKKRTVLQLDHRLTLPQAAVVANLSRNVIIESATPNDVRGHTMYQRYSNGSITHAEFRNLGKKGVPGRSPIHFYLTGDTFHSFVQGASIHDSDNRWITLTGARDLIIWDCVGYRSSGQGFHLASGIEGGNWLDRNFALQATPRDPQGHWWATSANLFTRNFAAECAQQGFRPEVER